MVTKRTGSYPFMNLADDYGLSLEVVYGYAHRVRERMLGREVKVWGEREDDGLQTMLHAEQRSFKHKVDHLVETYLKRQGWI